MDSSVSGISQFGQTVSFYLPGRQLRQRFIWHKKASEEETRKRACEDIWSASNGLTRYAGLEKNFELWNESLYAELLAFYPGSKESIMPSWNRIFENEVFL